MGTATWSNIEKEEFVVKGFEQTLIPPHSGTGPYKSDGEKLKCGWNG